MTLSVPTKFETERLVIRRYRPDDADWFYHMSLRNRPHLQRYESENPLMHLESEADAEKLMSEIDEYWEQGEHFVMGAFLKTTNDFAVQLYAGVIDTKLPELILGYFADVEHEGNGYVTEAVKELVKVLFTEVGVHRIRSRCNDTNKRSIGVLERCNFIKEGHFRKNKLNPDGTYSGTLSYALLREEYIELQE